MTYFHGRIGCGITELMKRPLSLVDAAAAIRQGTIKPRDLVDEALARIERYDSRVSAWVVVDAAGARAAAERLADELAAGKNRGPLHGIPIAIKDLVDVAAMPTRAGSRLTDPRPAAADATIVARLRAAGAIILGKTVTTEFACFDPSPTRNPWNLAHTPGGSSSGSAAAVALGMCAGAIASQTGGSITRPASYCGVAGIKPTFGRVSRAGVIPVSFHLDHVGAMGRTAADCGLLLQAIAGDDPHDPASSPRENFSFDEPETAGAVPILRSPPSKMAHSKMGLSPSPSGFEVSGDRSYRPRLGIVRPFFFDGADAEVAKLTLAAVRALEGAGAQIVELPLCEDFDTVHVMHRRLMAAEAADYHRTAFGAPRDGYGPNLAALLAEGFKISVAGYQEALRHQVMFRHALARTLAGVDALVTPSTPTAAPASLDSTGDPRFNSPWSHAGVPTVSIPIALTAAGLPISLQLVGPAWSESRLLAVAVWCERVLDFRAAPPMMEA
jgi:aspartyl-tRNA(Asn)/glutamyl-tRNA(Gln) amidotransferase subunit A